MNTSLYNKIMLSVAKVVKKSINEAYNKSIYDRYISSDDQSILNSAGNIGDILQINLFGDLYRVKSANSVNESMFDDIDFDDDDYSVSVSDKLTKWKDLAICFGKGLWVYLDWIGLNKELLWAHYNTGLHIDNIPDTNGYENTQYILNNYKNCIQETIWEEILNCEYNVYIPDKKLLERIYKVNKKYKLMSFSSTELPMDYSAYVSSMNYVTYVSSSLYVSVYEDYYGVFEVNFYNGSVHNTSKSSDCRTIALLHF